MSTLTKSSITGEQTVIYCKGSPEQMHSIFKPDTVPHDYHKMLKKYTCQGFRVLAIGHREVEVQDLQTKPNRLDF